MVALHGCLLAGAVAVPVDLRLTEEERARGWPGRELVLTELAVADDALVAGDAVRRCRR